MRDETALARVRGAVTRVEESGHDGDKDVVEVGLHQVRAVRIDCRDRVTRCDGDVVGRDADEWTCALRCFNAKVKAWQVCRRTVLLV